MFYNHTQAEPSSSCVRFSWFAFTPLRYMKRKYRGWSFLDRNAPYLFTKHRNTEYTMRIAFLQTEGLSCNTLISEVNSVAVA